MKDFLKTLRPSKTKKSMRDQQDNELEDIATNLASLANEDISTITDSIKKVAASQIEKNEAATKLINAIFDFFFQPETHSSGTGPGLSYTTDTTYTRGEVLSIIKTMRNKRATYKTIALYFQEKNIPTFSGWGEWYAQTIHRLCKQHNLD